MTVFWVTSTVSDWGTLEVGRVSTCMACSSACRLILVGVSLNRHPKNPSLMQPPVAVVWSCIYAPWWTWWRFGNTAHLNALLCLNLYCMLPFNKIVHGRYLTHPRNLWQLLRSDEHRFHLETVLRTRSLLSFSSHICIALHFARKYDPRYYGAVLLCCE
jgi:hypothetical protein